jgi:AMMECR1 domain-containing protein
MKEHVLEKRDYERGLEMLVVLNEAIDKSDQTRRQMFYQAVEETRFTEVLDELQQKSKSIRVVKEVEEFEDTKDDWERGR